MSADVFTNVFTSAANLAHVLKNTYVNKQDKTSVVSNHARLNTKTYVAFACVPIIMATPQDPKYPHGETATKDRTAYHSARC